MEEERFAPEDAGFTPEDLEPRAFRAPSRRRVLWTVAVLVVLGLMAVLPPLLNVSRYRQKIAASISLSLGRPVHVGEVTLMLLPFPGFTIQNFVVSEDPSFGSEPVIRASSVVARLRWRSLWRKRVEFSRITLSDASVNVVRRQEDGQWNLESILLQAARMPAAPTAQKGAGDRPRFPYIEAAGARVNVKMGLEKLPISLTEADFALWSPQAEQWRLRLEAHPTRTDNAVTDTGVVRLEGTLGRAARLAEVPVDLHASWTGAPLGAASTVVTGRDMGFRGELRFEAEMKGTVGDNALETRLRMEHVRRADFVPARLVDVDVRCSAKALGDLHRLEALRCTWPAGDGGLTVTGEVPDTLSPGTAKVRAEVRMLPAAQLLDALRLLSPRVSPGLRLDGTVAMNSECCGQPGWVTAGDVSVANAVLADGDGKAFVDGPVSGVWVDGGLVVAPFAVDLGAAKPAELGGRADWDGYRLQLSGGARRARLTALAEALPSFGDGLEEALGAPGPAGAEGELSLNLVSARAWRGGQSWAAAAPVKAAVVVRKRRR